MEILDYFFRFVLRLFEKLPKEKNNSNKFVKELMFARSLNQVLSDYLINHPGLVISLDGNIFLKYDSSLRYFVYCKARSNSRCVWRKCQALNTLSDSLGNVDFEMEVL